MSGIMQMNAKTNMPYACDKTQQLQIQREKKTLDFVGLRKKKQKKNVQKKNNLDFNGFWKYS